MRRPAREGSHGAPASQANATPAARKKYNQRTPRIAFANTDKRHRGARMRLQQVGRQAPPLVTRSSHKAAQQ